MQAIQNQEIGLTIHSSGPPSAAAEFKRWAVRTMSNPIVIDKRLPIILLATFVFFSANAADKTIFEGRYISESKENFGISDEFKFFVDIKYINNGSYTIKISADGKESTILADTCSTSKDGIMENSPPGEKLALCDKGGDPSIPRFVYSENGVCILAREKCYEAKYYARIRWIISGFRKLS